MTLSLIFNEQSLRKPASNAETARKWMTEFVRMLLAATSGRYNLDTLRTHAHFEEMTLAPDYPMGKWFNDSTVSKEAQDFVLTYATRHPVIKPFIEDLDADDERRKRSDRFIGSYEDEVALGLGFSYLLEGLAISVVSETCWDCPNVKISRLEEQVEAAADLIEDEVEVRHAGREAHLAAHEVWIKERNKNSVRDGKDLLRKAKKWYPHVVFAPNAESQLERIGRGDIHLSRIVDRLFDLERSYGQWPTGKGYDIDNLLRNASHESIATIQELGRSREFRDPKGVTRLCEMHLKMSGDNWRIHFWPDGVNEMGYPERKILVGYIGSHLEIASGF